MTKRSTGRNRRSKDTITTRSGKAIKLNRSLTDRIKARRAAHAADKAAYMSTLPKGRWRRLQYRLQPKHLAEYWFSREGAITALKIVGAAIMIGFFLTIGLFAYFRKDLPKLKDIAGDNLGGSITYYDRTGKTVLWQDYNAVKRIPVKSNQISPYMKEATVAIEDKNFYKEGAFDVRGIIRAAFHDAFGSGPIQGGSTITQQVVKLNENWTDNRTITRKIKELILAVELGREYSKNDILTGYLNIAPYGGVEYGVESAAEDYFHTSAKNLTLPEAAMLAAIPQSPSYYSPYDSPQFNPAVTTPTFSQSALIGRQHYILDQMAEQGYITKAQAKAAKQVDVLALVHQQSSKYNNMKAPYFVLAAKQQLEQQYGASTVQRGGWKVITTLDMKLQQKDDQLVAQNYTHIQRATAGLADEEANVTENVKTGQIVAMVGGVNFNNPQYGKINFASSVLIPPGSSFKPYDYTTFINNNNNVGAGSVLYDTEGPLPGYPCTNHSRPPPDGNGNCLQDYDFRQPGPLTLRYALGGSRNIPAVKAMLEAKPHDKSKGHVDSINTVISTASAMMDNTYLQSHHEKTYNCYRAGTNMSTATYADTSQCYAASAIGDGGFLHLDDHVNGLATIAREGKAIPRTFILKIVDAAGKTVYQWKQPIGKQVVKKDAAYIVDNMLADPNASYLPGSCNATTCRLDPLAGDKFQHYDGWDFAVKTGTTNDGFDGLMTSWSTQYATVSWVGNHTRNVNIEKITGAPMEVLTEPLTEGMMVAAHQGLKPVNWTQPKSIKVLPAFIVRNHIHYGDVEPSPAKDLFPSWYIGGNGGKSSSETIDKVSGKLATSCTPADAKQIVYNGNADSWNVDIFHGGTPDIGSGSKASSSNSAAATDDVHNCNDSPPTVTLTAPSSCPSSGCTITATVTQGTHPLTDPKYPNFPGTLTFTLNGKTIHSAHVSNSPSTVSFTYTPTSTGSGTLQATVTDSVLYQGSQSQPFGYTAANPITINGYTYSSSNQEESITWIGGSGTYTAYVNGSPSSSCQGVSGSSCTVANVNTGDTIYVKDSAGDPQSNTITVSGP